MKKLLTILKYFLVLFVILFSINLAACKNEKPDNGGDDPQGDKENEFTSIDDVIAYFGLSDITIDYDGKSHQIKNEKEVPDGVEISISNTKVYRDPGTYTYKATFKWNEEKKSVSYKLTINKLMPVYDGPTDVVVYLNNASTQFNYSFNKSEIQFVEVPTFFEVGEYTHYELKTKESAHYKALEGIFVDFHVFESKTGLTFESGSFVTDGTEVKGIYAQIPEGFDSEKYELVYENNESAIQGTHQAKCIVKDKATNEVVEEYHAILDIDYFDNPNFADYEQEMFVYFMEGDQSTANIFMVDYKAFGLEHSDADWYAYESFDSYTAEEVQHDVDEINGLRADLEVYRDSKLSKAQWNTFYVIETQIANYEYLIGIYEKLIMRQTYVDQYGGYCADFPTTMEAYSLRTIEDIEDAINYFETSDESFLTYYNYILDREKAGYTLSPFTLNSFNEYLDGVVKNFEDSEGGYYLKRVMIEKLDGAKEKLGLTDDQYNSYKAQFEEAIDNDLYHAHKDLYDLVKAYIDAKVESGEWNAPTKDKEGKDVYDSWAYLSAYEGGSEMYKHLLETRLGIVDLDMNQYMNDLDVCVTDNVTEWIAISRKLSDRASAITDGKKYNGEYLNVCAFEDPTEVFVFLKKFAKTIVPDLETEPTIDITWMDPTVTENTTTVAYYMKSPLDSFDAEYIHLNGKSLGQDNYETVSTLAHEGYPGHLYAYVLTKESPQLSNLVRIMTNTGFGEGWAKYVEYKLGDYIIANYDEDFAQAAKYKQYYDVFCYALYTRIDVGMGYQGWTVKDVASYLSSKGLNDEIAQSIFDALNEAPTQYAAYGYGLYSFLEYHNKAKAELGAYYDEIEFNQMLLSHGWCGLQAAEKYVNEYIANKKFEIGK